MQGLTYIFKNIGTILNILIYINNTKSLFRIMSMPRKLLFLNMILAP